MLAKFTESRRFYEPNFILSAGIRTLIEKARRTLTNTHLSLTLSIYTTLCPLLKDQQVFLREWAVISLYSTLNNTLHWKKMSTRLKLIFWTCISILAFLGMSLIKFLLLGLWFSLLGYIISSSQSQSSVLYSVLIWYLLVLVWKISKLLALNYFRVQMFWDSLFWATLFRLLSVKSRDFYLIFQVHCSSCLKNLEHVSSELLL